MSLSKIYNEYCVDANGWHTTDKGSYHDYLEGYYRKEFTSPERVTAVLEIGVQNGGSLILWHEWFTNAKIVGVDVTDACLNNYREASLGREFPRIEIVIADGYDKSVVDAHKDNSYDYIIDDGPHTLESMKDAIELWMPKVKVGGKLIIEDLQHVEWFEELAAHAEKFGYKKYRTFDLRENKGRYDDLIFELEK
jgi:cephalosporin hydroxylase